MHLVNIYHSFKNLAQNDIVFYFSLFRLPFFVTIATTSNLFEIKNPESFS